MHLSGVLERATPPKLVAPEPEPEGAELAGDQAEAEPAKGRGPRRAPAPKPARKIKGRTIYLPDDLFERIMVQAHRRDKTISEYVTMILERQVPDHRTVVRAEDSDAG